MLTTINLSCTYELWHNYAFSVHILIVETIMLFMEFQIYHTLIITFGLEADVFSLWACRLYGEMRSGPLVAHRLRHRRQTLHRARGSLVAAARPCPCLGLRVNQHQVPWSVRRWRILCRGEEGEEAPGLGGLRSCSCLVAGGRPWWHADRA